MIVVLDNLRSALNVGSIIRTCDAFGIKEIYFCGITPGPRHSKVLKTSLGAEENILVHEASNTFKVISKLKDSGLNVVGLEINENARDLNKVKITEELALVVGNEVSGLSNEVLDLCDIVVQIPMKGIKESLNVSVAFGIAAFKLLENN